MAKAIEALRNLPETARDELPFNFEGCNSMPSDNKDINFLIEFVHKILGKPYGWHITKRELLDLPTFL